MNNNSYMSYLAVLSEAANESEAGNPQRALSEFLKNAKNWITERIESFKKLGTTVRDKATKTLETLKTKFKGIQVKLPSSFDELYNKFIARCKDLSQLAGEKTKDLQETVANPNEVDDYKSLMDKVKEEISKVKDKKGFKLFRMDKLIEPVGKLIKVLIEAIKNILRTLTSGLSKLKENAKEVFVNMKDKISVMGRQIAALSKHVKVGFSIFKLGKKN